MPISSTEEPQTEQTHWTEKFGTGHPIFQIIEPDRHIKIYANGFVEGCAEGATIHNRIYSSIRPELLEVFSKHPDGATFGLIIGELRYGFGGGPSQGTDLYPSNRSAQAK